MQINSQIQMPKREPLNMGLALFSPISSVAGSATLFFTQPLLSGRVFQSAAFIIGSEIFLFIIERLFNLDSLPVLDINNGQTVQMPLSELQEFLRWMSDGPTAGVTGLPGEFAGFPTNRGYPTTQTPETPLTLILFVSADYSLTPYNPSIWILFPILTFPGVRGALPLIIIELLATIFVRSVVPPETTGSKPLAKPNTSRNMPLNFNSNDLIQFLTRFGKYFGTK